MDKAKTIEGSLSCFTYGCAAWVPVLGIPFIVLAMLEFQRARLEAGSHWNPARRYLIAGVILAAIGGFLSLLCFGFVLMALAHAGSN